MRERDALIKHLNGDERYLGQRLLDKVDSVLKNHSILSTDFLDPYQVSICTSILKKIDNINYIVSGLVKNSERNIILLFPDYATIINDDIPIVPLKVVGEFKKNDISHRDILGSILGLGIRREKVGDIYCGEGYAYIITLKDISDFIIFNLDKISKYKVEIDKVSYEEVFEKDDNFKIIHDTVPSLRLDVLLASGFGESRNTISKRINNDNVRVNWKPVNQSSYMINLGDIISLKGMGRIQLIDIAGKSKKDRHKITIKRFL